MDKVNGIDALIQAAKVAEGTRRSWMKADTERELAQQREQVLASIKAWCDCGKGDTCPQFGGGGSAWRSETV